MDDLNQKHQEIMSEAASNIRPSGAWSTHTKIIVGVGCALLVALWSYVIFVA